MRIDSSQARNAITRNTLWNILGAGLPLLVALVTIPLLIHGIGTERFGVLAIAWVVLGYFGLFDLGLGAATTKYLAEDFEHGREIEARSLFWTAISLNGLLGITGGIALGMSAPWLVASLLNVPEALRTETLNAFLLMAAAVPLMTITASLRGVLEARHKFGLLNSLQAPLATFTQVAPLLVLPFTVSLTWLVGALLVSRLIGVVIFFLAALKQLERPMQGPFFVSGRLRELLTFGGWLTVTNVIGPLMVYADRLLIGSLVSMRAVTYYVTPYEGVTRLWLLPHSMMRTLFPIFSAVSEVGKRTEIYFNSVKLLSLLLAPVLGAVVVFAPEILRLWVGDSFAENSTLVMQILAVGVFVNSLSLVPFNLIQGMGRTDVTAKLHLLELPIYMFILWYATRQWGISGAAIAWTVRVTLDGILLVVFIRWNRCLLAVSNHKWFQSLCLSLMVVLGGWLVTGLVHDVVVKVIVWSVIMGVAALGAWVKLLTADEKRRLATYSGRLSGLGGKEFGSGSSKR